VNDQHALADVLEVSSIEQLAALADVRPWRWFTPAATISLRIPSVGRALQETTERRLNFLRGVCGCQAGALFVFVSLAWYVAGPAQELDLTASVVRGGALVVGAGILGKVLTVVIARAIFVSEATLFAWRIRRTVQQRGLAR
jgi:hypothetical protein